MWSVGTDLDYQRDTRKNYGNDSGTKGSLSLDQFETVSAVGFFVQGRSMLNDRLVGSTPLGAKMTARGRMARCTCAINRRCSKLRRRGHLSVQSTAIDPSNASPATYPSGASIPAAFKPFSTCVIWSYITMNNGVSTICRQ